MTDPEAGRSPTGLLDLVLSAADAPPPDPDAEPQGFVVEAAPAVRLHFLDWGVLAEGRAGPGVLLVHGLAGTAWAWAPVARRLAAWRHVVALDLRGHGLSDAPTEGYDAVTLAEDVRAVAEGSELVGGLDASDRVVLAGHGFGAIVAAWAAVALGQACAGLVLVDGGWEDMEVGTGEDADLFLRTLEEPPEVLRSMGTFLADREGWDPGSWDADQDRASRESVVELPVGRVVSSTRPHALEASVRAMFAYDPLETLAAVTAPIVVLAAAENEAGTRGLALRELGAVLARQGRPALRVAAFPSLGHNLMRYRPAEVAAAILGVAREG